jgi:glycosyltransferase involved in cell wall biosynthesis
MTNSSEKPKLSIVIPTYNRADLIGETLRSVQDQDFTNFEVIIVDDGSTDGTKTVCEKFVSKDPRISYLAGDTKNRGPGYCRNKAVQVAQGEFLIFLDSDDLFLPGALANRVNAIESNDELDFVVFLGEFFEVHLGDVGTLWNIPTDVDPLLRFLGEDVPWSTIGPIWRSASFDLTGGWDDAIVMGDDQDLHTRALLLGMRYEFKDTIDYAIRRAAEGKSQLGQQFSTKAGMLSQVKRVQKLCEEGINLDGAMLARAQMRMAGSLLFRCYQLLEYHDDKPTSLKVWRIARYHRLVDASTYMFGCLWIKKYKSFLGDIAAYWIDQLASEDLMLINRSSIGGTPSSCLEEKPYDGRFHKQRSFVRSPAVNQGVLPYILGKLKSKTTCFLFT